MRIWDTLAVVTLILIALLGKYFKSSKNSNYIVKYFDKYSSFLSKTTLNYFTNDIIEPKI